MNLGRWSPNVPWARWQWWAARLAVALLAALAMAAAVWVGLPWIGWVMVALAAVWMLGSVYGEWSDNGPGGRGGDPS